MRNPQALGSSRLIKGLAKQPLENETELRSKQLGDWSEGELGQDPWEWEPALANLRTPQGKQEQGPRDLRALNGGEGEVCLPRKR